MVQWLTTSALRECLGSPRPAELLAGPCQVHHRAQTQTSPSATQKSRKSPRRSPDTELMSPRFQNLVLYDDLLGVERAEFRRQFSTPAPFAFFRALLDRFAPRWRHRCRCPVAEGVCACRTQLLRVRSVGHYAQTITPSRDRPALW